MANYHAYDRRGKIKTDVGTLTFDNLKSKLDDLNTKGTKLGIVSKEVLGTTVGKRSIYALKIGKNDKKRVLLVGCHHAREWISVEVPLLVGQYLIDNYKTKKKAKTTKEKRINYLVDNAETWIVPMLNPDGHTRTLKTGERMWRTNTRTVTLAKKTSVDRWVEKAPWKTESFKKVELKFYKLVPVGTGKKLTVSVPAGVYVGVDLNRNYPVPAAAKGDISPPWGTEIGNLLEIYDGAGKLVGTRWNLRTSTTPDVPDLYCGPSAGSEKEVDAVVKLFAKGNFRCAIGYHNFGQLLMYPEDAAKDKDVQFLGSGMKELYIDYKKPYDYKKGSVGLSGTFLQWVHRVHTVPNYTIELPPLKTVAKAKDWDFNKLPPSEIDPTFNHNLPVALAVINCAISGFTPGKKKAKPVGKAKVKGVRQCWEVFLKANGWTP